MHKPNDLWHTKKGILMKIIFIRHGEPNYEIDSLTEKGWREAELLRSDVEMDVTILLLAARTCEGYGFFYVEKCGPRGRNSSVAAGV